MVREGLAEKGTSEPGPQGQVKDEPSSYLGKSVLGKGIAGHKP